MKTITTSSFDKPPFNEKRWEFCDHFGTKRNWCPNDRAKSYSNKVLNWELFGGQFDHINWAIRLSRSCYKPLTPADTIKSWRDSNSSPAAINARTRPAESRSESSPGRSGASSLKTPTGTRSLAVCASLKQIQRFFKWVKMIVTIYYMSLAKNVGGV